MKSEILVVAALHALIAHSACPYMDNTPDLEKRQEPAPEGHDGFLDQFVVNDENEFTTTDFGTPVNDRNSLKAGERGPTLLEDFIFRTKMTRFDHERIPERAVHARGAAAHGYFESYADWSNITAASFLSKEGKQTPIFLRFSTVAGSRGSPDTVRDVHGYSLRLYTDEGNYDIVGNNIPVFFIQDAMQFPDLIHAVKPRPNNEIPQAGTAHDNAWDFFSQTPSSMHTLLWALSGHGIPRSYRHMDGFGVHTFRFVTDDGSSKLIKIHLKSKQGLASLVWPEAQVLSGKNIDYHRNDLFEAIDSGNFPEWELGVQVMDEEDVLRFEGIDLLDPTKIVPVEDVPITPIGKVVLNRNTLNYFAETEQSMYCPGHVVRGIDFSDDPLLQGRLFSYVDTQLNRNMGSPNFEQIPINRPRAEVHNNNRDGAGQQFIHSNIHPYSENTLNNGSPMLANQTQGNGFFTAPARRIVDAQYVRDVSPTFMDFFTQPRLFYNSLTAPEQQMLINAARFELSNVRSTAVRKNSIFQFNRIDHDFAERVASALGMTAPPPDPAYYNNRSTTGVSVFRDPLPTIATLKVGILASASSSSGSNSAKSMSTAMAIADAMRDRGAVPSIIAETLTEGVDRTYINSDAVLFDAIVVADGTQLLFNTPSPLYPKDRPSQIVEDAYNYGKPIAGIGAGGRAGFEAADIENVDERMGAYLVSADEGEIEGLADMLEEGLKVFKFLERFPID